MDTVKVLANTRYDIEKMTALEQRRHTVGTSLGQTGDVINTTPRILLTAALSDLTRNACTKCSISFT